MEPLIDIVSGVFVAAGAFFVLVGAIGLVRLPDLYTRIHGASVIDTAGAGLLVVGMMLQAGWSLVTLKLLFILGIFLFTLPVAGHALARAALREGLEPKLTHDRRAPAGDAPDAAEEA